MIEITLAHSPDPDDVFMWWPLFEREPPCIDTGSFAFEPVRDDIQTLNDASERAMYDITAISCAQYPFVADRYRITSSGASMGENYGPKLVARSPMTVQDLAASGVPVAVPGMRTTAALLTGMILGVDHARMQAIPFDTVIDRIASGEFEAGVVIHEGQLTFGDAGLHLVCDVGAWWYERFHLPLPLGLNVIKRDLDELHGPGTVERLASMQRASIDHALAHRERGIELAMPYARGVTTDQADQFVEMYVNPLTVDCGERGRQAIRTLLGEGARAGLVPSVDDVDVIESHPREIA